MNVSNGVNIEELKELLKPFPEYTVFGNKPYGKGTYIVKKGHTPKITQTFPNNHSAKRAMMVPGWEPSRPLQPEDGILFDLNEDSEMVNKALTRKLLRAAIDVVSEAEEMLAIFGAENAHELKQIFKRL